MWRLQRWCSYPSPGYQPGILSTRGVLDVKCYAENALSRVGSPRITGSSEITSLHLSVFFGFGNSLENVSSKIIKHIFCENSKYISVFFLSKKYKNIYLNK